MSLQARIGDKNALIRVAVVATIWYTFANTSQSYDEHFAPLIIDFTDGGRRSGLPPTTSVVFALNFALWTVRRLALSALNSASHTKAHLIRDHLTTLLLSLYKETVVNTSLVRTVQMDPWTHTVDDGLEARKMAYEIMYTLACSFPLVNTTSLSLGLPKSLIPARSLIPVWRS
jgi:cullin-associated NEDD8-dissociated protein 1